MRRHRTPIGVGAALAAACVLSVGAHGAGAPSQSLFGYDPARPLDVVPGKTIPGEVVQEELTFTGAGSDRLAADFLHPAATGPWAIVIWTPGYGEARRGQLQEALALARAGVASLLVDPPPAAYVSTGCDPQKDLANYVRYVVSRRRAIDVAQTLKGVDAKRVAAVGFSYGSEITGTLAGVESKRLAAVAFESGRGHETGFAQALCPSLKQKAPLADYLRVVGVVDPVNWLPRAGRVPVLVQNGTRDDLTPKKDVLALYAAARGPKELRWYDAGHVLNASALAYRQQWLLRRLTH